MMKDILKEYLLVIDDNLTGFKDAFIDERMKEITVSPAVFSLLQDSDSRATVLEQIVYYDLNFFMDMELLKTVKRKAKEISINNKMVGKW